MKCEVVEEEDEDKLINNYILFFKVQKKKKYPWNESINYKNSMGNERLAYNNDKKKFIESSVFIIKKKEERKTNLIVVKWTKRGQSEKKNVERKIFTFHVSV